MQTGMVKIGDNVRRYRQREALTQAELAEKAGIAGGTLSRIERNHSDPHMTTIRKLARVLGVRPRALVGD
jgi:XRE family transcriptional regulator, regulator of sulfur utilization